MPDKFKELDNYILSAVHELLYGTFERTGDGKDHLLSNYWYPDHRDKIHELVEELTNGEQKEEKVKDEKS